MGITIDIILCLLAVFIVVQHTLRGFVRSVFGSLKLVLAFVSAFIFTPLIFDFADRESTAVAYLLVFSASYILLAIAVFILDRVFELPVLNFANRILGLALGLVCAYITLSVASAILSVVLGFSAEQLFGQTAEDILNSSYVYGFFVNFSVFSLIG